MTVDADTIVADIVGQYSQPTERSVSSVAVQERRGRLIPILQQLQARYAYLPEPELRRIAARYDIPLIDVYHVATFYNCFSLEPVGRNLVQVCLGTACHVRGAPRVLDRMLQELKLCKPGTTKDLEFTVRTVRCVGCCGLAPVVRVNQDTHPHMNQAKVKTVLKKCGRNIRLVEAV